MGVILSIFARDNDITHDNQDIFSNSTKNSLPTNNKKEIDRYDGIFSNDNKDIHVVRKGKEKNDFPFYTKTMSSSSEDDNNIVEEYNTSHSNDVNDVNDIITNDVYNN